MLPPTDVSAWSGVVLAGGRSRRMGRDKAFVEVGGRPLVVRACDALAGAGAAEVFVVGGDAAALASLGLAHRPDGFPGEGPLGGVLTALRLAAHDPVVVLSCDLPGITPAAVRALVAEAARYAKADVVAAARSDDADDADDAGAGAGAGAGGGRARPVAGLHPLVAVYRRRAEPVLARLMASGERRLRLAVAELVTATVVLQPPWVVANANTPEDLPGAASSGVDVSEG